MLNLWVWGVNQNSTCSAEFFGWRSDAENPASFADFWGENENAPVKRPVRVNSALIRPSPAAPGPEFVSSSGFVAIRQQIGGRPPWANVVLERLAATTTAVPHASRHRQTSGRPRRLRSCLPGQRR